jgi:hypothetical protein
MAARSRGAKPQSKEDLQRIINEYIAETGAEEVDMNDVSRWAISTGRWRPPPYDPQKACARELSRAARDEYCMDPQGREVRKRHCYVIVEDDGQRRWHWVDIVTAKPDPMHKSLQSRRRSALADVSQLACDLASYNDNNLYGAELQMSFNFDEDLAEMEQPTEYPEDDPEGDMD